MSAGGMLAPTTGIQCIPSFVSVKINFHVRCFFQFIYYFIIIYCIRIYLSRKLIKHILQR